MPKEENLTACEDAVVRVYNDCRQFSPTFGSQMGKPAIHKNI